mmetsp:Transcript_4755/g.19021  ORF Transcript_4755/g.19021 Transcript_4755/m.19021 type:complete len:205 (+) Transcript_4755:1159-1773(+)
MSHAASKAASASLSAEAAAHRPPSVATRRETPQEIAFSFRLSVFGDFDSTHGSRPGPVSCLFVVSSSAASADPAASSRWSSSARTSQGVANPVSGSGATRVAFARWHRAAATAAATCAVTRSATYPEPERSAQAHASAVVACACASSPRSDCMAAQARCVLDFAACAAAATSGWPSVALAMRSAPCCSTPVAVTRSPDRHAWRA